MALRGADTSAKGQSSTYIQASCTDSHKYQFSKYAWFSSLRFREKNDSLVRPLGDPDDKQTDRGKNITSSAEVTKV